MKKEEREKFEKEINDIDDSISEKTKEIINTPVYQEIEELKKKLRDNNREDEIKHQVLRKEIHQKYTGDLWGYYYRLKPSNIKPSVKQGIKVGLGMKNIKSIENNIVEIVRELINKDLENPKIKNLHQKITDVTNKISDLRHKQNKLIKDGLIELREKRDKLYQQFNKKKNTKDKKLEEQEKEVAEKMKTLPKYLPKIIKEVNKRLILDGVSD